MWALPTPFAEDVEIRMEAIADRLPALDLDVIAFQEVWTRRATAILLEGGRRAGLSQVWYRDATWGGSGLLLLSRLPIRSSRFERYGLRGHPEQLDQGEFYGGKGFVRARIETREGPITLINTHLHARYSNQASHEYRALRAGQVVQLAMRALEIPEPIIATGDYNFEEDHSGYRVLTGLTGLRDIALELDRCEPTVYRGNVYRSKKKRSGKRIDYVFARDGEARGVVGRSMERIFDEVIDRDGQSLSYSNHAGVLAEIEITSSPAAGVITPDRQAIELAAELLSEGHARAQHRRRDERTVAGAGIGLALMAAAGVRGLSSTRRHFLRSVLRGAALLALPPVLGSSLLSEVFSPAELRAFEDLDRRLQKLDPRTVRRIRA